MALNAKTRYLVMNRLNEAIAPRDEMLTGYDPADLKRRGEIPKKFSPSFANLGTAKGFCQALASKYPGERFYVSQVLGGAVVETPSAWSDARVGALHDENLADDVDGDEPNE